jgi:hypothetical protein
MNPMILVQVQQHAAGLWIQAGCKRGCKRNWLQRVQGSMAVEATQMHIVSPLEQVVMGHARASYCAYSQSECGWTGMMHTQPRVW